MVRQSTTRQRLRSAFLWLHRWLGLASGIIVFIVAITGCIYVFEKEGRELFQHRYYHVTNPRTVRRDIGQLQEIIRQKFPGTVINNLRFAEEKDAAFLFTTKNDKVISVDPYTGKIIGVRDNKKDFFKVVLNLHRTLLLGKAGKQIIRWNVLIFFILCISGLILWWPKQRRFFKRAVSIRFKTKNRKRFNWDLHTVLGFYALLVLLIISLTGMFWVFDSVKNIVRFTTHQPSGKKEEKIKSRSAAGNGFPIEAAYRQAAASHPGAQEIIIVSPADSLAPIRITMQYAYTLVRKQNNLFFDQYSGKILRENLYSNYSAYDKVNRSNYQLHTGDMPGLGIGIKIIYFLAGLFAASLPITGFLIWWGRNKKKKKAITNVRANELVAQLS